MHGIREGLQAAESIDLFLMGATRLPHQGGIPKRSWLPPPVRCGGDSCNGGSCKDACEEAEEDVKTEVGDEDEKPWANGNGTEVAVEA